MSNECVLAIIGLDQGDDDLVAVSRMASDAGAELGAILVSVIPPPLIGGPGLAGDSPFTLIWEEYNRLERQASALKPVLKARGLDGVIKPVFCSSGDISRQVAIHANSADITVIGGAMTSDPQLTRRIVDGVLFRSSSPLMLLPKRKDGTLRPKRIVVGWDGRREAWIAVRSSINFLQDAHQVHLAIAGLDGEAVEEDGGDVGAFLSRHGVGFVIDRLLSEHSDPAIVLQRHAESIDADLIVMGAYGHSRLGERILGGTTETILRQPLIPVLLAR